MCVNCIYRNAGSLRSPAIQLPIYQLWFNFERRSMRTWHFLFVFRTKQPAVTLLLADLRLEDGQIDVHRGERSGLGKVLFVQRFRRRFPSVNVSVRCVHGY